MEKYHDLSEITKNYFHADLCRLNIEYLDDNKVEIHVEYSDHSYNYDYDIIIDRQHEEAQFRGHHCHYQGELITLNRNSTFEKAVESYIFHK